MRAASRKIIAAIAPRDAAGSLVAENEIFGTLQVILLMLMGHQNHQHHNNKSSNVLKTTKFVFSTKRFSDRTILNREQFESHHLTLACKSWHGEDAQLGN